MSDQIVIDNPTVGDLKKALACADDDQLIMVIVNGKPFYDITRINVTDGVLNLIYDEEADEARAATDAALGRIGGVDG